MAKERAVEQVVDGSGEVAERADCRACVHYPLKRKGINTTMAGVMREATEEYTKTFCGKQPKIRKGKLVGQPAMDGIDCTGKQFERA